MRNLFPLLLSGAWLAACQPAHDPKTETEAVAKEAVVKSSSAPAGAPADTARRGAVPRLLATFPDSLNTPDGLALAPDGRVFLSVPNMADNRYPARIVELTATGYRPFINNLPPEPTTKKAAPWTWPWAPTETYTTQKISTKTTKISSRASCACG